MSSFIDEAIVDFASGTGGSGAVGFHREKHVPRGGPNGADGGKGGDIILIADQGRRTLYDFRITQRFRAENGVHAIGNKRGSNGKSIELRVPVGTIVTDETTGEKLVDLNIHGMKFILCKGGRGGHGNQHYVSSVRQVPNFAEKGEPGEQRRVKLELKLLADVGLVGLPNAGKSTLISRISAAKPKIADYPFTTIVPNLGVVSVADQTFVVADLPGLIEGASQGHGLGHQFLKHVERCRVLIHVVDAYPIDESDPVENVKLINEELRAYDERLAARPMLLVINKMDIVPPSDYNALRQRLEEFDLPLFPVSAATGEGLQPLLYATLEALEDSEVETPAEVGLVLAPDKTEDQIIVIPVGDGWELVGRRILKMVAMTELNNRDAVRFLHRRLQRMGIIEQLREAGAKDGDNVYVGQAVFTFEDQR